MKSLKRIYEAVLKEFTKDGEVDYEMWERYQNYTLRILQLFLEQNNDDYTVNMPWKLIPYPRLKKIWEDWAKFGFVRDEKGLESICDVMESNTLKISVITMLAGHTPDSPDEYYEDAWGEHIVGVIQKFYQNQERPEDPHHSNDPDQLEFNWGHPDGKRKEIVKNDVETTDDPYLESLLSEVDPKSVSFEDLKKMLMDELIEKFLWYYIDDPAIGQPRLSDYGLKPLVDLTSELRSAYDSAQKVVIVDKMLNVVHQRSDLASWYVRGGSNALSDLSASPSERVKEE